MQKTAHSEQWKALRCKFSRLQYFQHFFHLSSNEAQNKYWHFVVEVLFHLLLAKGWLRWAKTDLTRQLTDMDYCWRRWRNSTFPTVPVGAEDRVAYLWCGSPADSFTIGNRSAHSATQSQEEEEHPSVPNLGWFPLRLFKMINSKTINPKHKLLPSSVSGKASPVRDSGRLPPWPKFIFNISTILWRFWSWIVVDKLRLRFGRNFEAEVWLEL